MSYLDKLLEGVEVEWKTLGEVCKVLRGKRLTKKELIENGEYPVFHGGLEPMTRAMLMKNTLLAYKHTIYKD